MHRDPTDHQGSAAHLAGDKSPVSFEKLCQWLTHYLATRAGKAPAAIDPEERFQRLGLDSMDATAMLTELGKMMGRSLSPTLVWEFPTPTALAHHLASGELSGPAAAPAARPRPSDDEPVAIIGLACRFPQAANPAAFWALLRDGVDAISQVPSERWNIDALYDPDPAVAGKMSTKWGGFLSEVAAFDAAFFGISPREAVQIDPQQRLAIELAWEALEDAQYSPESLRESRTGVFFGAMWMDYLRLLSGSPELIAQHTATGQDLSIVSARISYSLGLSGPSIVVNTACSSSLVAVHLACQSLLRGESRLCLAGGVNLLISPESTIAMSKFGAMAPDGRCKAFDAQANGYVRGEGGGVVVLKRLSEALADGDRIYCVIRGSAVNNDGFSNGLTAPNPRAQEAVLRQACANAGVEPTAIDYVEAHGTGTMLGDPIEAGALGAALGVGRSEERPLRIGSVKTNIGHLEAAAGIAGLIKVILAMQHRLLPPSLHFASPNPHIQFQPLRLKVQTELASWTGRRLLAGVSSFGFGGTNCHIVLEASALDEPQLFLLSASSDEGLQAAARQRGEELGHLTGPSLTAVCQAAAREPLAAYRLSVVVQSRAELAQQLMAFGQGHTLPGLATGLANQRRPRVAFVFGGQGSQWRGMGRSLLADQPVARAVLEQCDREFRRHVSWSLLERLNHGEDGLFEQTDFVQPALFALQLALSAVWRAQGLLPDAVIGQSLGEVAAACVAGALSLEDAARVICQRSQLVTHALGQGGMAVVGLSLEATTTALLPFGGLLTVAVSSSAAMTVVAGQADALAELLRELQQQGVSCRLVRVDYASHSPQMEPLLPELRQRLTGIAPRSAQSDFYSTVLAAPVDGAMLDAAYWARNLREPVMFAQTMQLLVESGVEVFVEVDPHPVLAQALEQCLLAAGSAATVVPSARRDEPERVTLIQAAGRLLVAGVPVQLPAADADSAEGPRPLLVVLSAKDEAALNAQAARLGEHLQAHPELSLGEVAYSLATTRSTMPHRLALTATDSQGLQTALQAAAHGQTPLGAGRGTVTPPPGKLAFLFTGQGSQVNGMGRGLYAAWGTFREAFDRCVGLFDRVLGRPLKEVMWGAPGSAEAALLEQTEYTQPAIFALEYAMYQLWSGFGVTPVAVAGHSIGEIVAACVAGVFTLEDATKLCAARGRLMQALPGGGAMVSIAAGEEQVAKEVAKQLEKVSIAAVNGPEQVVIAGERAEVEKVADCFARRGVRTRELAVSHAFHSPMMEPMLAEFRKVAQEVTYHSPRIGLVGNVSGKLGQHEVCEAEYWVRHVRAAVRFADGVRTLHQEGVRRFLELGPQATLVGLLPGCVPAQELWLQAALKRGRDEVQSVLEALGGLWTQGQPIEWTGVFAQGCRRVALPTYPWQRQHYWVQPRELSSPLGDQTGHPLLGVRIPVAGSEAVFSAELGLGSHRWLGEHRVAGQALVPGAGLAELCRAAGEHHAKSPPQVVGLVLQTPLVLPATGTRRVQVVLTQTVAPELTVTIYSQPASSPPEAAWTLHATARIELAAAAAPAALDLPAVQARCTEALDVEQLYTRLAQSGLAYGPAFQGVRSLSRGAGEVLAEVRLAEGSEVAGYGVHPALLDAAFQALLAMIEPEDPTELWLPFAMDRFVVYREGADSVWAHVRRSLDQKSTENTAEVTLADASGAVVAQVNGLRLQRADREALQKGTTGSARDFFYQLVWPEAPLPEAPTSTPEGRFVVVAAVGSTAAAELARRLGGCAVVEPSGLGAALEGSGSPAKVICLWEIAAPEEPPAAAQRLVAQGLKVVQALLGRQTHGLWWVTTAAVAVHQDEWVEVAAAPLWGLGRTVMQEHPELGCTLVDLAPGAQACEQLLPELSSSGEENQVAWRGERRHAARLVRAARPIDLANTANYQLQTRRPGTLAALHLVPADRPAPGPGEVLIEVRAAGLNFRDVLSALGVYPGPAGPLGQECAGIVVELGEGARGFSVGDAVMALVAGAFGLYVVVDARLAAPVPAGLSLEQAASIPVAFLTAWYALHDLAQLQPGERVLVHAAAGGVGMAAVQLARQMGAEVYATASPDKWEVVRALGVQQLASSRTLEFATAFRPARDERGVEVVLNALAGEFVDASLSLLSSGGRLLEMGKTDVRTAEAVAAVHPGVRYRAFDLWEAGPERIAEMLAALGAGFAAGKLRPLPVRTFPLSRAEQAFRFMAQAQHVGKLVLVPQRSRVSVQGTVLVTGGLGALGVHVARWLAQQGVEHLLLTGRRGIDTPGASAVVAELTALGARVTVAAVDVAEREALSAVLQAIPRELPLRGVVHAAGVLDDGVLTEQTPERFARVLQPKVAGAWHLHELTADQELEFFVLFSSMAGLLGAAGQSNYAAANAFLDALAVQRRARGRVGQSLAWGPWAETGMTVALDAAQQARLARQGIQGMSRVEGIALWESALMQPEANLGAARLDLRAVSRTYGAAVPPVWRTLVRMPAGRGTASVTRVWAARLALLPPEHREQEVRSAIQADVARVLALGNPDAVPLQRPFKELGVDSLMAVELRSALSQRVGKTLPATVAFDHPTVQALTLWLLQELLTSAAPQAKLPAAEPLSTMDEPIAIVGIGCRFPGGVQDPESFWRLLAQGRDAITEVPKDRWDVEAYYDPDPDAKGKMITRWGGFLDGIDRFEPEFFGISPREAESIDPQQRLLLETSWEALERAGQTKERLLGSDTGVYMGLCGIEYQSLAMSRIEEIDAYSLLGTAHSASVGRLSYWLGLQGPNVAVDTACSSSLVAVHLACQALRSGECSLALAGGVNLVLSPAGTVYFSRLRAMSPTGRCRTFADDADGYVRSEGCGVVVLKPLRVAQRDGDPILAVIRGSAVNQDGRSNGLTAPNGPAQEAVIRRALKQAGIASSQVGYVETHGTGTPLGDPIEVQALGAVLGSGRSAAAPLLLGSVKTNLGHTEGAAGVAGLIKAVLCLQQGVIPQSLHFRAPNQHIQWSELKVQVATEAIAWRPAEGSKRVAGVSAFGFSGTNAHVVVEEAEEEKGLEWVRERAAELVVLSAGSEAALREQAERLSGHLGEHPEQRLYEVACNLATRREGMDYRLGLVVETVEELKGKLKREGARPPEEGGGTAPRAVAAGKVAILFTGQGAQVEGMGRGLYKEWEVFREAIKRCAELFDAELDKPLLEVMWGEGEEVEGATLEQTRYTQPAMFALEYAMYELWKSWGVEGDMVLGHSIGELVAACVSGVMTLEEGVRLCAVRGRLMQGMEGGGMVTIWASEREVEEAIEGKRERVSIAAVNGPEQVVIAGEGEEVGRIASGFEERGVRTKRLAVSHAFHSPMMEPMLERFQEEAEKVRYQRPSKKLVSNLSGKMGDPEQSSARYWVRHVREAVRFADGVRALYADGARTFLEIGPKATLLGLLPECLGTTDVVLVPSLRAGQPEPRAILAALGSYYAGGGEIDWRGVFPQAARRVELPTYPWQRQRYWLELPSSHSAPAGIIGRWPLTGVGLRMPGAVLHHVLWVGTRHQPFLADHVVFDKLVVPGAFHLAVILSIATELWLERAIELTSVEFLRPMALEPGQEVELHSMLTPEGEADSYTFELATFDQAETATDGKWMTHARGRVRWTDSAPGSLPRPEILQSRATSPVDCPALFARMSELKIDWGPLWRWLKDGFVGGGASLGTMAPTYPGAEAVAPLHPTLLDNGFAVSLLALLSGAGDTTPRLPFALERLRWWRAPIGKVRCGAVTRPAGGDTSDFVLIDSSAEVVAEVEGFVCRRAPREVFLRTASHAEGGVLYRLQWQESPLAATGRRRLEGNRLIVATAGSRAAAKLAEQLGDCPVVEPSGLAGALPGSGTVTRIVCLWEPGVQESPADAAERLAGEGLQVVQALRGRAEVRLWWVTRAAIAVQEEDPVELSTATLWGLGRTVMQEQPELGCTLVDLEAGSESRVAGELTAEDGEEQIAWRSGHRYVARLMRGPRGDGEVKQVLAPHGTVLITGGLGGLGLHVARWLARQGTAHLLLIGRQGLASPHAAEAIAELQALGARVTVAAVDVAAREALREVIEGLPTELPLRAVFHTAGVLDDGVLAEQTAERFARVMRPKVAGSWNLHELSEKHDLDYFVMFSSVAAILGSAGQSGYAAANSFLDALAAHRRAKRLPAHSLAWGVWAESGMAVGLAAAQKARLVRQGMSALTPEEGIAALQSGLQYKDAQLGIAKLDLGAVERALGRPLPSVWRTLLRATTAPAARGAAAGWAERMAKLPRQQREQAVRAMVSEEVARVMMLGDPSKLPWDRPLGELGLDSLLAVELRNALGQKLGRTLPATLAFDHPTVGALVKWLIGELLGQENEAVRVDGERELIQPDEPIAIVGIGCRYPGGVQDPEGFWNLLRQGLDAVSEMPKERWDADALYDPDPEAPGKMVTKWGGFLSEIDQFDASFFGISSREAEKMDPQQRILLETSWEALEQAGIVPESLVDSNTGVFMGLMYHEYEALCGGLEELDGYVSTGSGGSVASGRISYILGLKGPSLTVDTACSSSLVAVHLACQSLRQGECGVALAGGVTLMLRPTIFVEFSRLRGIAPDGRSKSFSAAADGVAWGEGCGVLVLKRLTDARREGDTILGVIRGSAVNQDGRSHGMTAPNGLAQQALIKRALQQAGVGPAELGYVECHGTGTKLGDPIEAQALGEVLKELRGSGRRVPIGSVKSNIGHTQAAAGVAGIIKVVLALEHELIPRSLHAESLNPHIHWSELPLQVTTQELAWPRKGERRLAGVSSFGISGTNAHVVVEEGIAGEPAAPVPERACELLVLSAKSQTALAAQAARLLAYWQAHPELTVGEVAASLATTRSSMDHRLAIVATSRPALHAALETAARGQTPSEAARGRVLTGSVPKVVFVFPGQGSQWLGMGRQLLAQEPAFRESLLACDKAISSEAGFSVLAALTADKDDSQLERIAVVQPVMFALAVALAALWRSWGVEPDAVVGHSLGEVAAAHVSGALSLRDAVAIVCLRSRLLQRISKQGEMALIELSLSETESALVGYEARLSVAVSNSQRSTVIAGEPAALAEVLAKLEAQGVFCRRVKVDVASHSPQVEPLRNELVAGLSALAPQQAAVPMLSTVSCAPLMGPELGADYWAENLRQPVRFAQAVQSLVDSGHELFIEISPHPLLVSAVELILQAAKREGAALGSLRRGQPERATLLAALGGLWVQGYPVDWRKQFPGSGRRVQLPTYPWQRQRHWTQAASPTSAAGSGGVSSLLDRLSPEALAEKLSAAAGLSPADQPLAARLLTALRNTTDELKLTEANRQHLYRPVWKWMALPKAARHDPPGTWLILGGGHGLGEQLARALEAVGAGCICLERRPEGLGADASSVYVDSLTAVSTALSLHASSGSPLRGIVDLWSAAETDLAQGRPADGCERMLVSALAGIHALAQQGAQARAPLWLLTRGAVTTGPGDPIVAPAGAALWGLGRVLFMEHPELSGGLVDLPSRDPEKLISSLVSELLASGGEEQIALRTAGRYVQRLTQYQSRSLHRPERWKTQGTALVTGGLGALGLQVARWLIRCGAQHLVLTGRRGLATPGAAQAVAVLEGLGGRVTVAEVDVSDSEAMRSLLAQVDESLPPLRTIIHAAGVAEGSPLFELTTGQLQQILAAKVQGTMVLEELTRGRELDAFVCFSSISAVWGAPAMGNYAAANAFLDAWAQQQGALGRAVLSVDWGPWEGGGMVSAELLDQLRGRGIRPFSPEEALNALALALSEPAAQLVVAAIDWPRFRSVYQSRGRGQLFAEMAAPTELPVTDSQLPLARRLVALSPEARRAEVQLLVCSAVAVALRVPAAEIPHSRPLQEIGIDSLLAVELRTRLANQIGVALPATLAFDYPTVMQIGDYLLSKLLSLSPGEPAAPVVVPPSYPHDEAIAIVGMSCRFPGGVNSPEDLWALLEQKVDAIIEVPKERWDLEQFYDPDPEAAGKMYSRWGGFVDGIDQFDAGFFRISNREALSLDPQQRFLLEVSWEALERAGIPPHQAPSGGVFIGISGSDYGSQLTHHRSLQQLDAYAATGSTTSAAAGRLAYTMGFTGPAMAVDTACSSSLVSVHLACQSLRQRECELALAGGVNLLISPESTVALSRFRALSPDGRCKAFDAAANGFVRSEGCGVLVLKRLSDATRDGNPILAVIRGSAVNQDGRSNGFTAPSGPAQQAVIQRALAQAGVLPAQVGYVETHGTGTSLGDPIELQALGAALKAGRSAEHPVLIGALKSNIGHTEAAAGVAGVIKAILALQHHCVPANLHFQSPSPHIQWSELPVQVPTAPTPWPDAGGTRIAGVSSFGLSGTNAHVILAEAPPRLALAQTPADGQGQLLVLSARTPEALSRLTLLYAKHLAAHPELPLSDLAFAAAHGRSAMEERWAVVASTAKEAEQKLEQISRGEAVLGAYRGHAAGAAPPKVAFLFTGQGAQYVGMGRELYESQPVFRAAIDECAELLAGLLPQPLTSALYPSAGELSQIDETALTQPALFAVEYALAQLWQSMGVLPSVVLGHSVGEYVAACVAGVMSLQDALLVVAERGRLMQTLAPDGAMAVVHTVPARVASALLPFAAEVSIAAFNAPEQVVISGKRQSVTALCSLLEGEGIKTRPVVVSHAFHSPLIEPILADFARVVSSIELRRPRLMLVSNLSGRVVSEEVTHAAYWTRHVREPVQFLAGMQTLRSLGVDTFIEAGPQPTLLGLGAACLGEAAGRWLPSLRKGRGAWEVLLESLGRLFAIGAPVELAAVAGPHQGQQVVLPTYPWQHERYWSERTLAPRLPEATKPRKFYLAGLSRDMPGEVVHQVVAISPEQPEYLGDHRVFDRVVVAGAFYLAVVLAVAAERFGAESATLREVLFVHPLILVEATELHLVLTPAGEGRYVFTIATPSPSTSTASRTWREHAKGELLLKTERASALPSLNELHAQCPSVISMESFDTLLRAAKIHWGARWLCLTELYAGTDAVLGKLIPPAATAHPQGPLHPTLIDNAFAALLGAMCKLSEEASMLPWLPWLPWTIRELRWYGSAAGTLWCQTRLQTELRMEDEAIASDAVIFAESGRVLVEVTGLVGKRARPSAFLRHQESAQSLLYQVAWRPASLHVGEGTKEQPSRWLVFLPRGSIGDVLAAQLAQQGHSLIMVELGDRYEQLTRDRYRLAPGDAKGYRELLQEVSGRSLGRLGIVHLWSLDATPAEPPSATTLDHELALGLYSALHLVQSLAQIDWATPPRLWLVTAGAQAVVDADQRIAACQAALWGFGQTVETEYAELACTRIDLSAPPGEVEVAALLHELLSGQEDAQVALRADHRYLARLVRAAAAEPRATSAVRADGSYLITGGLGGLGLSAAELLAAQGARHLVLASRRPPDAATRQVLDGLQQAGTQVFTAEVDIASYDEVATLVGKFGRLWPPLRGILHTAAVVLDGVIAQQSQEMFREALAAKVHGAWNLHLLTQSQPLDFFVGYSSIASLFGGPGQSSYAAANAFVDALAHLRRRAGQPGMSINWGGFSERGLAARRKLNERFTGRGMEPISPAEGKQLLWELLSAPRVQVAVVKLEPAVWVQHYHSQPSAAYLSELVPPSPELVELAGLALVDRPPPAALRSKLLSAPAAERPALLVAGLREHASLVLRTPAARLGPEVPFTQLGMDSLMAIELRDRLVLDLQVTVPLTLLVRASGISELADYILKQLPTP